MTAHKLLLHPADPSCPAVGLERLAECLQAIGLIGKPVPLNDGQFYPTGDRFLQLVTFLGCAPLIELDPPADPAQCRKPEPDWKALIQAWQQDPVNTLWQCTACGHADRPTDLRFRKTAGFGKTWVEIRGIHPSEAIPGDALLAALRALSGCDWNTLYMKE